MVLAIEQNYAKLEMKYNKITVPYIIQLQYILLHIQWVHNIVEVVLVTLEHSHHTNII